MSAAVAEIRIPRKKLSKANVAKVDDIIGGYSLTDIAPTGSENIALMIRVLKFAVEEKAEARRKKRKSRFDMRTWTNGTIFKKADGSPPPLSCGTSACLAGTAAAFTLADDEAIFDQDVVQIDPLDLSILREGKYRPLWTKPHVASVRRRGRDVLGLTRNQSDCLFYLTSAKIEDIVLVASYIVGVDLQRVVGTA